jgi:flagellar export protein FliJ
MTNEPRAVWGLLVQKAERRVQEVRLRLHEAEARQAQLLASLRRVQAMAAEYRQRHARVQQGLHSMRDTLDHQRFMDQLGQLTARMTAEAARSQLQCQTERRALQDAEQDLRKNTKLEEIEMQNWRSTERRREQRGQDEQALRRFTWQEV